MRHLFIGLCAGFLVPSTKAPIRVPVFSKEDALLKQQLLDRSANAYEHYANLATQYEGELNSLKYLEDSPRLRASREEYQFHSNKLANAQKQLRNATTRGIYVQTEIVYGTAAEEIYEQAYGRLAGQNTDEAGLWHSPKRRFTFQGKGDYPSLEADVFSREEGYAKQEILDYALARYAKAKKEAARQTYRLQQARGNTPVPSADGNGPLEQAQKNLQQAQTDLQHVRAGIHAGQSINAILKRVYGYDPVQPHQQFLYRDLTASPGPTRGFYATASTRLDFEIKQDLLNQAAAAYNQAKQTADHLLRQMARLEQETSVSAQAASQLAGYRQQYEQAARTLQRAKDRLGIVQGEILKGSSLRTLRQAVQALD